MEEKFLKLLGYLKACKISAAIGVDNSNFTKMKKGERITTKEHKQALVEYLDNLEQLIHEAKEELCQ